MKIKWEAQVNQLQNPFVFFMSLLWFLPVRRKCLLSIHLSLLAPPKGGDGLIPAAPGQFSVHIFTYPSQAFILCAPQCRCLPSENTCYFFIQNSVVCHYFSLQVFICDSLNVSQSPPCFLWLSSSNIFYPFVHSIFQGSMIRPVCSLGAWVA